MILNMGRALITIFLMSYVTFLTGCAEMTTKGDLDLIGLNLKIERKMSVSFRITDEDMHGGANVILRRNQRLEKIATNGLSESGYFSEVKNLRTEPFGDNGLGSMRIDHKEEVAFPIRSDYFIDIINERRPDPTVVQTVWLGFHVFSFGLVPIFTPNNVTFRIYLYDKQGNLLQSKTIQDRSTIVAWSPLFFFNGFKMHTSAADVYNPIRENAIRYFLRESMEKEGVFTKP